METKFNNTPEQARRLVAVALRSGKYKQGQGWLCRTPKGADTPEYCCLGVATIVAMESEPIISENLTTERTPGRDDEVTRYISGGIPDQADAAFLPEVVQVWLGFRTNSGAYAAVNGLGSHSLTQINDSDGASFEDIAAVFETPPDGLLSDTTVLA